MVEGALNRGAGVQRDLKLVESREFLYSLYYQSKRNVKTHTSKLQEGPMEDKEHKVIKLKGSLKHTRRDTGQGYDYTYRNPQAEPVWLGLGYSSTCQIGEL